MAWIYFGLAVGSFATGMGLAGVIFLMLFCMTATVGKKGK